MSRWLYLLVLLWAVPAQANPSDMLLPYAVETQINGWKLLHYDPQSFEPGEVRLVMFCLRAVNPLASSPMIHVIPEGDRPRRDKLRLLVSQAGASAVASGDLPPYITYRVENTGDTAMVVDFQIYARKVQP